jgi:predicted permease
MRQIRALRLRFRSVLRQNRVERELDDELRYHVERLTDEYIASGLSPADARYAALREMGPIEPRREQCRDARGLALVDSLRQDVTYALRALRKSPGFTAVAMLSLALGIGANTTIFTFVNAVLLRPLPYPESERIVTLREQQAGSQDTVNVHPLNFVEWRARAHSFEALALVQTPPLNVLGPNGAEQILRVQTTPDLFQVFGVEPVLGRSFTGLEASRGADNVVVLGHGFWQRWFGGDPSIIGRQLAVREGPLTIVGVAPPGMHVGLAEPDAFTPLSIDPTNPGSIGSRSFQCYGRLKRGVSVDTARAEMSVIATALAKEHEIDKGMGVFVSGLHEYLVQEGRPALRLLIAVVATVLLIACANLAGLLLARGLARRGELAVRASLGASRGRLLRQLVVESLVLALFGGAAGLALAFWATEALVSVSAGALTVGSTEPIRLDATCLAFTFLTSTLTTLVFGLVPALHASRVAPQAALREQMRMGTADPRQQRMRQLLVTMEVAMAVVLLVGAGLLLRTFSSLLRVDLGFQPSGTVTMGLFLGVRPPETRVAMIDQIIDRVEALPGVKAASTIQFLPLTGMTCGTGFWIEGQGVGDPARSLATECSMISRGYFAAMGIPVLEGRAFDSRDRAGAARVVMINRSFARRYFPDGRAVGRRVLVQATNQALAEIVGVAGDIRHNGLTTEPAPTVFLLHAQTPGYITTLVVRTAGEAASRVSAIRRAIHEVDPTQAVSGAKTLEQYLGDALARPRMYAALVTAFALIALTLAVIGVYGMLAYSVAQRTREIGIRLALGAARQRIFLDLFRQGVGLISIGLACGVAASFALRKMVSTLLFGVTPADPVTFLIAAIAFATVSCAAIAIPAHRASRVEPLNALRLE